MKLKLISHVLSAILLCSSPTLCADEPHYRLAVEINAENEADITDELHSAIQQFPQLSLVETDPDFTVGISTISMKSKGHIWFYTLFVIVARPFQVADLPQSVVSELSPDQNTLLAEALKRQVTLISNQLKAVEKDKVADAYHQMFERILIDITKYEDTRGGTAAISPNLPFAADPPKEDLPARAPDIQDSVIKSKYIAQIYSIAFPRWEALAREKSEELVSGTRCKLMVHISPAGKVNDVDLVTQDSLLLMAISIKAVADASFPEFPVALRSEAPDGLYVPFTFTVKARE